MSSTKDSGKPNRLIKATSPYLLQHAYNPVEWYEWGSEALSLAKKENKPILVSIGYSSCHWCHVMERESFEHAEIASVMNEHLVCIKIDREERPDIDQLYMDAVQAMGINGGWPLNVFLTPDQKPFYGGTYFPPKNWAQLIIQLSRAFKERRSDINQSSEELAKHLRSGEMARFVSEPAAFATEDFRQTYAILESKFDNVYGGLDKAPKFVMPTIWMWLLRYHHMTKNQASLDMVLLTLRQLAAGGIYDQIGGGFSRYSVDGRWFAPHFEKMLYDNAQLISLYSEAYRLSPDPVFRDVVYETIGWLNREMKHPGGGYYSALDADSEGVEGKFYTWTNEEINKILADQTDAFSLYYQVTDEGNWEHGRNILFRSIQATHEEQEALKSARLKLLKHRENRIRPGLDDKIITSWNAMLVVGFADAYKTFGDPLHLQAARSIIAFIEANLMEGTTIFRTFRDRRSGTEGFLEDYAHLISAYIALYECCWDESLLTKAAALCERVTKVFIDDADGFYFIAGSDAEQLIARRKEVLDNVIPASNSVMARNLFRLGTLLDRDEWKKEAIKMVTSLRRLTLEEPSYMSNWGMLALEITFPFYEIVITGPEATSMRDQLARTFLSNSVLLGSATTSTLPLISGKESRDKTQIHVCTNKTCKLPVTTSAEALKLMSNESQMPS